ncbi:CLM8 protein, partial [Sitta europaea]|nr:CLM8 protein [Sitta europaea]
LQSQSPETQRRREGDTLYIQCPYTEQTEIWYPKYWLFQTDRGEQDVVNTNYENRKQSIDGRTKIKDDSTNKTVSITMTDLKAEDSGTYLCVAYKGYYTGGREKLRTISLNVFKAHIPAVFQGASSSDPRCQATSPPSENTFIVLTVVLLILLLLALVTAVALGVRHYRLLERTGNREAEDTSDRPEGTAQPGCSGRRESSLDASKGPAYTNLEMQSQPSLEDPLYCNVELSQAGRDPQHVEYAVIAFSQPPRNGRE